MRCSRSSFRLYIYLVIGMVIGSAISSFIQISFTFQNPEGRAELQHRMSELENNEELQPLQHESNDNGEQIHFDYNLDSDLEVELPGQQAQIPDAKRSKQSRDIQDLQDEKNRAPILKLSDELSTRKPLLIAVITSVQQLMSQTIAIHGTWAKEDPNVQYFVGDVKNMPHLPHGMNVIQLEGIDDKQATWEMKEMALFKYIIKHYSEQTDWYLVISDDTYVKPMALRRKLGELNPSTNIYMGNQKTTEHDSSLQCNPATGVVYSKGLLSRLEQYLPQCLGEGLSIGNCIIQRGIYCTRAQEVNSLFLDQSRIIETSALYTSKDIINQALILYPIRYPKFMYRLHGFIQEIRFNSSMNDASHAANEIKVIYPFIPIHLRSAYKPLRQDCSDKVNNKSSQSIHIHPSYKPRNKFEVNVWDYFNETRLMSINSISGHPYQGIIGGFHEEKQFVLSNGISVANQGLPSTEKLVFDKLENGYHRVDPMRGSEYVLDFVFRKSIDKSTRVRKRISLLRPFHETIVPIDASQHQPRINFIVTLSGLSERLEQFLKMYEKIVLLPKEQASLTITLYSSPDADNVHQLIKKYSTLYPQALFNIIDLEGTFARGVGLHHGVQQFKDNELMFFVDIDFDIEPDFLRRARLNTVKGKQVYFPVIFKLYKLDFVKKYYTGNDSQGLLSKQNGQWAHYAYGIVVIYAGDYRKVGGLNTSMKGWGGEDVDFFQRVISSGMEVFRAPDHALVHRWHPKICNKDTVARKETYISCMQSKSENLADKIELAQYVFLNELKNGNPI